MIRFSPLLVQTLVMSQMSIDTFFINPTTILQLYKPTNLLISHCLFDFWAQPNIKLDIDKKLSRLYTIVWMKFNKLHELDIILSDG